MTSPVSASATLSRHPKARILSSMAFPDPPKLTHTIETVDRSVSLDSADSSEAIGALRQRMELEPEDQLVVCCSPKDSDLKISLKRVLFSPSDGAFQLGKRSELPAADIQLDLGLKRTKSSILRSAANGNNDFSASMIPFFERLYGETLFDNSIGKDPSRQAELAGLQRSKFKSYRGKHHADGLHGADPDLQQYRREIVLALTDDTWPDVSASRTLAFLALMPTERAFYTVLDQNRSLVAQFFNDQSPDRERAQE